MTQEQKRIKIAEACGWKPDDDGAGVNTWAASYCGDKLYGLKPRFKSDGSIGSYITDCLVPDYFNDLNAMHEAEKNLTALSVFPDEVYKEWIHTLWRIVFGDRNFLQTLQDIGELFTESTAAQRAEAFGKTLNLW